MPLARGLPDDLGNVDKLPVTPGVWQDSRPPAVTPEAAYETTPHDDGVVLKRERHDGILLASGRPGCHGGTVRADAKPAQGVEEVQNMLPVIQAPLCIEPCPMAGSLVFPPQLAGALVCYFADLRHSAADHCFFWILYLLVCIVHTLLLNPYTVLP